MLWNDGKLPEGIDQEKLFAEHASQPRNRNIANAFYKAGFIETWGRGINKIRQGLKRWDFLSLQSKIMSAEH